MSAFKMAIVGKKEEILAFRGVGVDAIFVKNVEEAEEKIFALKKDSQNAYAVVFVMEDIFQEFSVDLMDRITKDPLPAFLPLPGHAGSTGFGDKRMKKFVEQAVGSDIFGE